ncbi:MAG: hypothetical protein JXB88_13400 [Spirochaetales bacterium]|nr:hypothetical protein [Spirochaetales bacterium]
MNQQQAKEQLLELNRDVPDFTVIFTGKKSKKVDGLYHPETKEILIHNKNHENDNQLMYTAIHEFAHHIQFTTSAVPISTRAHTINYWNIFHTLLYQAEELGIYKNIYNTNGEFLTLTRKIRQEILLKNGHLMVEFGRLLKEARSLCEKYKVSFTDYLDRILNVPRASARSIIKVQSLNINPEIGYENMKTVSGIHDEMEREQAVEAFLAGHSPDMVKMQFKRRPENDDPVHTLQKEQKSIKKRIATLTAKLQEIEKRIEELSHPGPGVSPDG